MCSTQIETLMYKDIKCSIGDRVAAVVRCIITDITSRKPRLRNHTVMTAERKIQFELHIFIDRLHGLVESPSGLCLHITSIRANLLGYIRLSNGNTLPFDR